ncbi:unnamed protein product, partial [Arctogadus glacialis]
QKNPSRVRGGGFAIRTTPPSCYLLTSNIPKKMSGNDHKSPADFESSDHPDSIAMRDQACKTYHICVDEIYTKAKYFAAREKVHKQQLQFLRSEVERLSQAAVENTNTINQLGLDLGTSQASLTAMQTDLDATKNELDDLHCMNASQELDDLHCMTASQDTDSPHQRLCSTRVDDDDFMDENGNGDLLPGP